VHLYFSIKKISNLTSQTLLVCEKKIPDITGVVRVGEYFRKDWNLIGKENMMGFRCSYKNVIQSRLGWSSRSLSLLAYQKHWTIEFVTCRDTKKCNIITRNAHQKRKTDTKRRTKQLQIHTILLKRDTKVNVSIYPQFLYQVNVMMIVFTQQSHLPRDTFL